VAGVGGQSPAEGQLTPMALTMRPAGLSSGTRTARITPCSAASGILAASMKFEAAPSIYGGFGRCTDNRVATLEAAKAEFEASWDAWKAWAKLEEAP